MGVSPYQRDSWGKRAKGILWVATTGGASRGVFEHLQDWVAQKSVMVGDIVSWIGKERQKLYTRTECRGEGAPRRKNYTNQKKGTGGKEGKGAGG